MIGPYNTLQAFRDALGARLKAIAQSRGIDLQRLQRRVAFDRLLAQELELPALTLREAHAYLDAYWQRWELGLISESDR